MSGVTDWLLSLAALILMVAFAFGSHAMVHLLQWCMAFVRRLNGPAASFHRKEDVALRGVALFFFLLVGVPVLAVIWGYATGRLPAASPYAD